MVRRLPQETPRYASAEIVVAVGDCRFINNGLDGLPQRQAEDESDDIKRQAPGRPPEFPGVIQPLISQPGRQAN